MAGKAGLKAGLIGTAVMLMTTLINQFLPISGGLVYAICGVNMLIYAGIGVLAGFFLASPRTPGKGAGAGAIAGLISGGISGREPSCPFPGGNCLIYPGLSTLHLPFGACASAAVEL